MKRFMILTVLLILLAVLTLPCLAAEDYYLFDNAGWLTAEEGAQLRQHAEELSETAGIDFLICIADDVGDQTSSEYSYDYYYNCDCSADSLVLLVNTEKETISLYAYGDANDRYPQETLDELSDPLIEDFSNTSSYLQIFNQYLDRTAAMAVPAAAEQQAKPDWYPEDVNSFVDFHAVNPPHVVDDADLFTDAQEAELSAMIAEIVDDTGMDLAVFTDTSSYGLPRNVYAADFYQFNGYGLDEDYSGSVLLICMEPGNRGWYTAVCGQAQDTLNSKNLNVIDDRLEPHMKSGAYFDGVSGYLNDIAETYRTGHAPTAFPWSRLGICFLVALVIALVIVQMMQSGMKVVRAATHAQNYLVPGSFDLRKSYDIFLFRSVTRVKREKQSSSGGSFSSSGGRSFSGSGRSF